MAVIYLIEPFRFADFELFFFRERKELFVVEKYFKFLLKNFMKASE